MDNQNYNNHPSRRIFTIIYNHLWKTNGGLSPTARGLDDIWHKDKGGPHNPRAAQVMEEILTVASEVLKEHSRDQL